MKMVFYVFVVLTVCFWAQSEQAEPQFSCPKPNGFFPDETDCTRFYSCARGTAFVLRCPEGLAYNAKGIHCDWPDKVDRCNSEELLKFECPKPEHFSMFDSFVYAHETDCRKHYVCSYGKDKKRHPRLLACQNGQVFNPDKSLCDDPENVPECKDVPNDM